jgi:hypothetical protein
MQTYTWSDIMDLARLRYGKGIPLDAALQARLCDMVSSTVWTKYPWFLSRTTIAAGLIPLVDGTQDYSTPANFLRITKCSLLRTDTTPNQAIELNVSNDLPVDLVKRSPYSIKAAASQAGVGKIRLEAAVQVPTGTTWEINGEYQQHHAKVSATSQNPWWHDDFVNLGIEGLLYQLYKIGDDSRAGGTQKIENGKSIYTGQLATFHDEIDNMYKTEDYGGIQSLFPDSPMGQGRDANGGFNIYP